MAVEAVRCDLLLLAPRVEGEDLRAVDVQVVEADREDFGGLLVGDDCDGREPAVLGGVDPEVFDVFDGEGGGVEDAQTAVASAPQDVLVVACVGRLVHRVLGCLKTVYPCCCLRSHRTCSPLSGRCRRRPGCCFSRLGRPALCSLA